MAELFASGRIIDLILGLVVIEAITQIAYSAISARGPAVPEILLNLAPGAFLMLALRASLTARSWQTIALALTAALFCHLADIGYRWRRRGFRRGV